MKVDNFLSHHGLTENPSTAVVFGEKGSGKTAIRLTLAKQIAEHNLEQDDTHPDKPARTGERVLVVAYDDFNPVLDKLTRARKTDAAAVIQDFRLADHQDAILGHAVTKLADALLNDAPGTDVPMPLPNEKPRVLRKRLTAQQRLDLAVLAGLYDQPPSGITLPRWKKLCKTMKIGWRLPLSFWRNLAGAFTLAGGLLGLAFWWLGRDGDETSTNTAAADAVTAATLALTAWPTGRSCSSAPGGFRAKSPKKCPPSAARPRRSATCSASSRAPCLPASRCRSTAPTPRTAATPATSSPAASSASCRAWATPAWWCWWTAWTSPPPWPATP